MSDEYCQGFSQDAVLQNAVLQNAGQAVLKKNAGLNKI
jgi:hypothetical protein